MIFSDILKRERKRKKLTQTQLAEILNVSDKTISSWENQRSYPDILMLKSIAVALDVDPNILLDAEELKPSLQEVSDEDIIKRKQLVSKFKKNIFSSILLFACLLMFPIAQMILNFVYRIHKIMTDAGFLPDYEGYRKMANIVYPIILIIAFFAIIFSIIIFIRSTLEYKNNFVDLNKQNNYKLIFYKLINYYIGFSIMFIYIFFTHVLTGIFCTIFLPIIAVLLYIGLSYLLSFKYNLKFIYNNVVLTSCIFIMIAIILIILFIFLKYPMLRFYSIDILFVSTIILLSQKEVKKIV